MIALDIANAIIFRSYFQYQKIIRPKILE